MVTTLSQSSTGTAENPLLRMQGIHKYFPGVHALRGVDFDVRSGEVHALVGENGAGKSTLMHILAGVYQPDAGAIDFNGHSNVVIESERLAQRLGIAIVFQERSLFSDLSIAENVFAARQPTARWGRIDRAALHKKTGELLSRVGLAHHPRTRLADLSLAQQQMVEIAKALSLDARLIVFDEPTAALSDVETDALFRVIQQLSQKRVGIIYISHRLEEIFQIADRVTVLKDGAWQGTLPIGQTSPADLIVRMVGREINLHQRRSASGGLTLNPNLNLNPAPTPTPEEIRIKSKIKIKSGKEEDGHVMLKVRELTDALEFENSRPFLQNISFHVRAGEIVVFAGLAGAGRTELALSLFGVRRRATGRIELDGKAVRINSPKEAIAVGLGYASEDRKESGLFLEMNVAENIVAAQLERFGSYWFNERAGRESAQMFCDRLRISTPSVGQTVRLLSGGNQQKVVLSKWLLAHPKVLIVDEPTRGIDVGAKAEVHLLLSELADQGTAVLVISSDLPEVLAVADRVIIMREGRIAGELAGREASEEEILRLASTNLSTAKT